MTPFVVTSFYTNGTGYEKEAQRLKKSLLKHDIPHYVVGLPSHGDWRRNIYEKAQVIQRTRQSVPFGHAVVWLDADAEVMRYPHLFHELGPEIGFAYHNRGGSLSSGTMYFGPGLPADWLLGAWINRLNKRIFQETWAEKTEQAVLKETLNAMNKSDTPTVRVADLPLSYSTIFDGPQPDEPVVIRHHQASRRLRRKV